MDDESAQKTLVGNVMWPFFAMCKGQFSIMVNANQYADTIMQLQRNLKNCQRGKLSEWPVLLHDNVWLYSANLIQLLLDQLNEIFCHIHLAVLT